MPFDDPAAKFNDAAVRDAIGLVRLLWRIYSTGTDLQLTNQLLQIGKELAKAFEQGRGRPGTLGYRAAIARGDEAVDQLEAMEWTAETKELIQHAQKAVRGGRTKPRPISEREAKREAARMRS